MQGFDLARVDPQHAGSGSQVLDGCLRTQAFALVLLHELPRPCAPLACLLQDGCLKAPVLQEQKQFVRVRPVRNSKLVNQTHETTADRKGKVPQLDSASDSRHSCPGSRTLPYRLCVCIGLLLDLGFGHDDSAIGPPWCNASRTHCPQLDCALALLPRVATYMQELLGVLAQDLHRGSYDNQWA